MSGRHQHDGKQRSCKGTDGVHRLAQAVGRPPAFLRCDICNQRIARRAANPLADTVYKACRQDRTDPGGEREQRFCQRCQSVTQQHQRFPSSDPVGEYTGKDLGYGGSRLGDPFDQPYRQRACAQHGNQEHRQKTVDHLGGEIHEEAHQAECYDPSGEVATGHLFSPATSLVSIFLRHCSQSVSITPISIRLSARL